jgi:hypothetical protein
MMTEATALRINDGIEEAWAVLEAMPTEVLARHCQDVAQYFYDYIIDVRAWSRQKLLDWWVLRFDWDGEDQCWRTAVGLEDTGVESSCVD